MNGKVVNFIKNFSYTLFSNLISLLISTLVVLILPKLVGVEEYGYWQLYLFYISYVGLLHFGWNDGIYLRYGGEEYDKIDKKLFFSQFYMLFASQIIIAIIISVLAQHLIDDNNRIFIFQMTSICLLITNIRHMLLTILQTTNRIKEYAQITIMGRVLYFLIIILFLFIGIREYKLMIIADLLGKFISLLYAVYCCRDIVFNKIPSFYFNFKETFVNISVGVKLMFANIASMLIIGIVRFGIEQTWSVEIFGKVSLTLSASNLMMIFINAVGVIMYPILKRTNEKKFPEIYLIIRDFLMIILLGLLVGYYPLKTILSAWLPEYSESLTYMALLFPMFIYEGKMALLINTYLKTLRKEKMMLIINLISVFLSLIFTIITTLVMKNLDFAILTIVLLLAIRSILAEAYVSKLLKIKIKKDIVLEIILTITFMSSGWFINSWYTTIIYGVAYVTYLIVKRRDLFSTFQNIKSLIKV